jgi:hypothetical protein
MIIKFIKSPTGKYKLAYNIGGVMDCKDTDLATRLIDDGFAELVEDSKPQIVKKKRRGRPKK